MKLHYEEALWWPGGAPAFSLPSKDIVRDIIQEAHKVGIPVLLHATTPKAHEFALDVKVDILAHGLWEWPDQDFDDTEPDTYIANLARRILPSVDLAGVPLLAWLDIGKYRIWWREAYPLKDC